MISGHKDFFFFLASNLVGRIFFPFFSHKLSITIVLHANVFFRQALAGNVFSKSASPPPKGSMVDNAVEYNLCLIQQLAGRLNVYCSLTS